MPGAKRDKALCAHEEADLGSSLILGCVEDQNTVERLGIPRAQK